MSLISSVTDWYELGEKNNKYFLTLERRNKAKTHVKKLLDKDNNAIIQDTEILKTIEKHFSKLFEQKSNKTKKNCYDFLQDYPVPKLTQYEKSVCERQISENECLKALEQMGPSKTPGNDGLTKELYLCMWEDLKEDMINCFHENFEVGALTTTQKQIVITLLEKQGKDVRSLDSWRPISLINVDSKICSRVLSNRLSTILPNLIHLNQSAFVKGRKIDELLLTLQDVIEYVKEKNVPLLLLAADFEKAFDSIEHNFIIAVLEHFNFGENFIRWIKLLLMDNLSCVTNNGKVTNFFPIRRGTKQGDPISPYIFILVIEILAVMIRQSTKIEGLTVKHKEIKMLIFADDTTFFLKDKNSFQEVDKILNIFAEYSSLRINIKKSEAGWLIRTENEDDNFITHTGMKQINFDNNGIKILGLFFSHNENIRYNNNLQRVLTNFKTVLSIWKTRSLTLYGKIQVLRTLALPKLYYVCTKMFVSKDFIQSVESELKNFVWNGKKTKIKHETLIGDYEKGGLKIPDFHSQLK